jgi:transglutaminase-like putative cysteine protease
MSTSSAEKRRFFKRSARSPRLTLNQLWQQIKTQPLHEPENSLLLRILVQALVTVGIVATDVAAADGGDFLGISLWAVPVSLSGAGWSWQRRRYRNVPVKFCIAIGMLLALAVFFMRLLAERNDARLALAILLIHLQVLHSFDLPRRKDLGYSAVIGLILLGVAATLSQTLAFAPLLLMFLAIAIPVLVLDYRSRLGLPSPRMKQIRIDLPPKQLGGFFAIILGLGLAIFLLLPRLPGYQLRSFPVSAPIPVNQDFNSSAIVNSGYVHDGKATNGENLGNGMAEEGPGEIDKSFYYGFNSRINQNLRGAMQPQVVMRVRSQAPGFWRVLAFDHYTGQGWEISRNEDNQIQTLERPTWSFRFELPWLVTLNRTREVIQSYTIVSDLPNLIPALHEPKELYFPTTQVAVDQEGGLRSPVPLSDGLTYTVLSEVPYRDRTLLQQAPVQAPSAIQEYYLQLPETIAAKVRQQTERILAQAPNPLIAPSEKALYLAQHLKQNYTLQPNLPFFEASEDLVEAFLFKYKGGYPDHFSTALTVMLRSIGIPARLVMGFGSGQFNPLTGFYVVRNTDAFAMTEVYFHKYGWFTFDPIPGHEVVPPSIEDSHVFGVLQQFWNWIAGWLPAPLAGMVNYVFALIAGGIEWLIGWLSFLLRQGWIGILAGLGILTGLGFLGWLGWCGWRIWRYRRWLTHLPPVEAVYQQMLRWLDHQGSRKSPDQTPLEYAEQCLPHYSSEQADAIAHISHAYVRWRYGGQSPNLMYLRQQLMKLQRSQKKKQGEKG